MVRIAIVDDHELMRSGLAEILRDDPELTVVWSGESLTEFLADPQKADLVLLDLDLRGDPPRVADIRSLLDSGTRILVVSALASHRVVQTVITAGVCGVVSKGEGRDVLVEAIRVVADDGTWFSARAFEDVGELSADTGPKPQLTPQETRVLELYTTGMKIASVARRLSISEHTVRFHLKSIRQKFAEAGCPVGSAMDLYKYAEAFGLLRPT